MISTDSPLQFVISFVTFIVAIGILVAVHEFGHFWVARKVGIRVLRFSIGFGKPIYRRMIGKDDPVEFVIASIPLGGYVKLLDEREGNVAERDLPLAFNRQPVWKRIATLLAGPASNMIFAIAVYWVLFSMGVPALKPVVGEVTPDSIAARAGLRFEDEIVKVGARPTPTLEAATLAIIEDLTDDGTIDMRVRGVDGSERDVSLVVGARSRSLTQPDALLPGLGFDTWQPRVKPFIAKLTPGSAGDRAGLKVGDEILAIDGEPLTYFQQLVNRVKPNPGRSVTLHVRRDGSERDIRVTIGEDTEAGQKVGRIGISPKDQRIPTGRTEDEVRTIQKYGMVPAIGQAVTQTWDKSVFTLRIIGRIITGEVSLQAISGPIGIAETTGLAARLGWRPFLNLLALISISLGVLNLLPIPILDGGQVVYQLAELVKGRPVSERAQILGQQIGIAMLILMMTLAFYNDIARHLN
jgi:regulator of sigma E protease